MNKIKRKVFESFGTKLINYKGRHYTFSSDWCSSKDTSAKKGSDIVIIRVAGSEAETIEVEVIGLNSRETWRRLAK